MVGGYPDGRDWDNMQEEKITEESAGPRRSGS
jgi:hypothetical protein